MAARELVQLLLDSGRVPEGVALIDEIVPRLNGRRPWPTSSRPSASTTCASEPGARQEFLNHLNGRKVRVDGGIAEHPPGTRSRPRRGRPIRVVRAAERALAGGRRSSTAPCAAAYALAVSGRIAAADRHVTAFMERAQRTGCIGTFMGASGLRARMRYLQGRLVEAEADALAMRALDESGSLARLMVAATHAEVLIDQGRLDEAERRRLPGPGRRGWLDDIPALRPRAPPPRARRGGAALDRFTESGAAAETVGHRNPALVSWRSGLALAHHRARPARGGHRGRGGGARARAPSAAPRARPGPPRARRIVRGGEDGLADLRESVAVLHAAASTGAQPRRGSRSGGTVELGELPPERGYRITGAPRSLTGFALDRLADVNGDGAAEVLVGAPGRKHDPDSPGNAFVVFGRTDGAGVALESLGPDGGVRFAGPAGALFGTSVSSPGDVNGDGRADVSVGAPLADPEDRPDAGSAFVLFTPPAGQAGPDSAKPLPPAQGLRIDGANAGDIAGEAVDPAGDIDGDGSPDVAVSSPLAGVFERDDAGVTSIVYAGKAAKAGAAGSKPVRIDLSGLGVNGFRVASGAKTKRYVRTARAAGDLDADGAADLIVSEIEGRPTGRAGVAAPFRTSGSADDAPGSVHVVLAPTPKPKPAPLPPDPGEAEEVAAGCKAATRVELIIDDSGSMSGTDPKNLRGDAVRLLLAKPRNVGRTLGAVEFGSLGGELFPPQVIADPAQDRAQRDELFSVLERTVLADNGGTDYNAGFAAAVSALPDADARIFLTDGEHNTGKYENGHRRGPRTFVVGLGVGRNGEGAARLERIARETGAAYYPSLTSKRLQPVLNQIDSRLNCDVDLDLFVDNLEDEDVGDPNEVELDEDTESVDLAVSWEEDDDVVTPGDVDLLGAGGKVLATVSARAQRKALQAGGRPVRLASGVTLLGTRAQTFYALRLTGVGRYRSLRVRTATRRISGRRARINTQVGQSRRRR